LYDDNDDDLLIHGTAQIHQWSCLCDPNILLALSKSIASCSSKSVSYIIQSHCLHLSMLLSMSSSHCLHLSMLLSMSSKAVAYVQSHYLLHAMPLRTLLEASASIIQYCCYHCLHRQKPSIITIYQTSCKLEIVCYWQQGRPSPLRQWCISPLFQISPFFKKNFRLDKKFPQFDLFQKKFRFSSAKILTTFF